MLARIRGGLNNPAHQDYFSNRRFTTQKEIQQRRNAELKIKFVLRQIKAVNVKTRGQIVRKMTVRRCAVFPAAKRLREY